MKNSSNTFGNTLIGALAGFVFAWLSSAVPDAPRLAAPGICAALTWLLLEIILPWLTQYFSGSALTCRALALRIFICIGGWALAWLTLGVLKSVTFARSIKEAIYTDNLSVSLFIAFGLTVLVILILGKLLSIPKHDPQITTYR